MSRWASEAGTLTPMPLLSIPYRTLPSIDVGFFDLHTFGLLVALGILAGATVARQLVARAGESPERFDSLAFRAVLGGLVGARLSWVVSHLDSIDSPLDVIAVWDGGLQFSGGFLVAVLVAIPWMRRMSRAQRWVMLDAAALGLTIGLAIGRLGCLIVGEHLGGPTDFFLATRYLGGETVEGPLTVGVAYHQTALYEALHLAVLAGLMWALIRTGRTRVGDGLLSAAFCLWYAVARFATDFLRVYDDRALGLTGAQWIVLVAVLPAGMLLFRTWRRRTSSPSSSPQRTDAVDTADLG